MASPHDHLCPEDSISNVGSRASACSGVGLNAPSHAASSKGSLASSRMSLGPISAAAAAAGMGSFTFCCVKCGQNLPIILMSKNRKNTCIKDEANYKSLTDRWAKNRSLREYWTNMSDQDKEAWYRKQQEATPGTKRKFDEIDYNESSVSQRARVNKERDWMQPWDEFLKDKLPQGHTLQSAGVAWQAIVDDPNIECEWARGQWLVPKFLGKFRDTVASEAQMQATTRTKAIDDASSLTDLRAACGRLLDQFSAELPVTKTMPVLNDPHVDSSMAEQPVLAQPVDIMANSINREAHAKQREQTLRGNNEQEDMMQASLQRASGAGRPKGKWNKDVCIERLKVASSIGIQLKYIDDLKTKIDDGYSTSKAKLDGISDQSLAATVTTLLEELVETKQRAKANVSAEQEKLLDMQSGVGSIQSLDDVATAKKNAANHLKEASGGATKIFFGKVKAIQVSLAAQERKAVAKGSQPQSGLNIVPIRVKELADVYTGLGGVSFNAGIQGHVFSPWATHIFFSKRGLGNHWLVQLGF